jgi:GT2 family glycosyltransferase
LPSEHGEVLKQKVEPIEPDRTLVEAKFRETTPFLEQAQGEDRSNGGEVRLPYSELQRAERNAWDNRVRRADLTARLKERDHWINSVKHSLAWKLAQPLWKLQRHFSKPIASPLGELSEIIYAVDSPVSPSSSKDVVTITGWCFAHGGPQVVGIRARVGLKSYFGRYGFPREDIARKAPDYPGARYGGFSISIPIKPGTSSVRLEAIAQGTSWKCFAEYSLVTTAKDRSFLSSGEVSSGDVRVIHSTNRTGEERLPVLNPNMRGHEIVSVLRPLIDHHVSRAKSKVPLFSIMTATFNTLPRWLAEAGSSVLSQTFADWEWCLSDAGSNNPEVRQMLESLARAHDAFKINFAERPSRSVALNQALELARGEFVCFLEHDALLHPEALAAMAEKLKDGFDVAYSDEDKMEDATGELKERFFKPAWSPEYFRGGMYVGHLLCVRRELAAHVRFDTAFDGVEDFDFMLRISETDVRITQVPRILYHRRKAAGTIGTSELMTDPMTLEPKALNAHFERLRLPARAKSGATPHRLKIIPAPRKTFPKITIIVPTKDAPDVLSRCLNGLFQNTGYPSFEIVLADNNTTNYEALKLMRQYPVVRINIPDPFNFSRANNVAAKQANGEYLVFLNNDTEVISGRWLDHLLYYAEQRDVGAVGALLLHEDDAIQHAGVLLGMGGTADHAMRGFIAKSDGYEGNLICAREVSAVTAACMAMRKSTFEEIGGFNECFCNVYQDLELCLRLRKRGLRIIWTPHASLLHHESYSRQRSDDVVDRELLLKEWGEVIQQGDPYYNPNLNIKRGDYSWRKEAVDIPI